MKTCARCGKRLSESTARVYSRFTDFYYCADVSGCAKRAARLKVPA